MKRTDPQMRIRLPVEVKDWLEREAAKNLRTQNSEIVMAIREKMAAAGNEIAVLVPAAAGNNTHLETSDVSSST